MKINQYKKGVLLAVLVILLAFIPAAAQEDQKACIACHKTNTPGLVEDWNRSEHSDNGVTCYTCHQVSKGDYSEEHHTYQVTPVVSPEKCGSCHEKEYTSYSKSKHAYAAVNGPLKPWYQEMKSRERSPLDSEVAEENPPREYIKEVVSPLYPASGVAKKAGLFEKGFNHTNQFLGCMECHGSYVYSDNGKLQGWPNLGPGRVNPDGSLGSCASCHSAHEFSIEEARKPESCGKCHLGYDHPQLEIYKESSYHGARYEALGEKWNWEDQPWEAGEDFSAPTCAACHMSEIAKPTGGTVVEGTHDVGSRLKWEIQAKFIMYQSNNSNLAQGGFQPDKQLGEENRERMERVCHQCHSDNWTSEYFKEYESVLKDYNVTATYAYNLLQKMYDEGLIDEENPIDEQPEILWYYVWHHDGRRWRMGASMMGPDYTHWQGAVDTIMDKVGKMQSWYEEHGGEEDLSSIKAGQRLESTQGSLQTAPAEPKTKDAEKPQFNAYAMSLIAAATFALASIGLIRKFKK